MASKREREERRQRKKEQRLERRAERRERHRAIREQKEESALRRIHSDFASYQEYMQQKYGPGPWSPSKILPEDRWDKWAEIERVRQGVSAEKRLPKSTSSTKRFRQNIPAERMPRPDYRGPSVHTSTFSMDFLSSGFPEGQMTPTRHYLQMQWQLSLLEEAREIAQMPAGTSLARAYLHMDGTALSLRQYIILLRRQSEMSRRYNVLRAALSGPRPLDQQTLVRAFREAGIPLPDAPEKLAYMARRHRDRLYSEIQRLSTRLRPFDEVYSQLLDERSILWQTRDVDDLFRGSEAIQSDLRHIARRYLTGEVLAEGEGSVLHYLEDLEAHLYEGSTPYPTAQERTRAAARRTARKAIEDHIWQAKHLSSLSKADRLLFDARQIALSGTDPLTDTERDAIMRLLRETGAGTEKLNEQAEEIFRLRYLSPSAQNRAVRRRDEIIAKARSLLPQAQSDPSLMQEIDRFRSLARELEQTYFLDPMELEMVSRSQGTASALEAAAARHERFGPQGWQADEFEESLRNLLYQYGDPPSLQAVREQESQLAAVQEKIKAQESKIAAAKNEKARVELEKTLVRLRESEAQIRQRRDFFLAQIDATEPSMRRSSSWDEARSWWRRHAELPVRERFEQDPRSLVGQIVYSVDERGSWRPLVVRSVAESQGRAAGVIAEPFGVASIGPGAQVVGRVSLDDYLGFLREAYGAKQSDSVRRAAARHGRAFQEQEAQRGRFAQQKAKEITEAAHRRKFLVSLPGEDKVFVNVRQALERTGLADYFTVLGDQGQRMPRTMARAIQHMYPHLLEQPESLNELVQEAYQYLFEDLLQSNMIQQTGERVHFGLPGYSQEAIEGMVENKTVSALRRAMRDLYSSGLTGPTSIAEQELQQAIRFIHSQLTETGVLTSGATSPQDFNRAADVFWRTVEHVRRAADEKSIPAVLMPLRTEKFDRQLIQRLWAEEMAAAKSPISLNFHEWLMNRLEDMEASDVPAGTSRAALREAVGDALDPDDLPHVMRLLGAEEFGRDPSAMIDSPGKRALTRRTAVEGLVRRVLNESFDQLTPHEQKALLQAAEESYPGLIRTVETMAKGRGIEHVTLPVGQEILDEWRRIGLLDRADVFVRFADDGGVIRRQVPVVYEGQGQLSVPSTAAKIGLDKGGEIYLPAEVLDQYRSHAMHPVLGTRGPDFIDRGGFIALNPEFHPSIVQRMGYSAGDVIASAQRFLKGDASRFLSIDVETPGLLEAFQKVGRPDLFIPTEIGIASFERSVGEAGKVSLNLLEGRRLLVRPTEGMTKFLREEVLPAGSETDFVRMQLARRAGLAREEIARIGELSQRVRRSSARGHTSRHLQELRELLQRVYQSHGMSRRELQEFVEASRQVYRSTIRGYAGLVSPAFQDPVVTDTIALNPRRLGRARSAARRALDMLETEGVSLESAMSYLHDRTDVIEDIVAANAARAERVWLDHFSKLAGKPRLSRDLRWHDPLALFRATHPSETKYNLGHVAQTLGIPQPAAGRHLTFLLDKKGRPIGDIVTAAHAFSEGLEKVPKSWMDTPFVESGHLIRDRSGRVWLLDKVQMEPGTDPFITAKQVIGSEVGSLRRWSGAMPADLESTFFGRYQVVASQDDLNRAAWQYWEDRARREVSKLFRDPSTELFQAAILDPSSEGYEQRVRELIDSHTRTALRRVAGTSQGEVYRNRLLRWITGPEAEVHRPFLQEIAHLRGLSGGDIYIPHQEASSLLARYYDKVSEAVGAPMRPVRFIEEGFFPVDIQGVRQRSVNLSTLAHAERDVKALVDAVSRGRRVDRTQALSIVARALDVSIKDSSKLNVRTLAESVREKALSIFEQKQLMREDILRSQRFVGEGAEEAARQAQHIGRELLKYHQEALQAARAAEDGSAMILGGQFKGMSVDDLIRIAEGHVPRAEGPFLPKGFRTAKEAFQTRSRAWHALMNMAYQEGEGAVQARRFLGIDSPDLGKMRVALPLQGRFGVALEELTGAEISQLRRQLRPQAALEAGIPTGYRRNILRWYLQEHVAPLQGAAGRSIATQPSVMERVSSAAESLLERAGLGGRKIPPKSLLLAAGAVSALGLWALGSRQMHVPRPDAFDERQAHFEPRSQSPQGPGMNIIVRARRPANISSQEVAHATAYAIQQSMGIPMNVSIHEIDNTQRVDRRFAEDVMLELLNRG